MNARASIRHLPAALARVGGTVRRWTASLLVAAAVKLSVNNLFQAARRWSPDRTYIDGWVQDARLDCNECDRLELVRKSRFFEHNDALAQRLAEVFVEFTVGPNGLVVSPESSDEAYNQRADDWFTAWQPAADLQSRLGYGNLMTTAAWRRFFDGEYFLLKTFAENRTKPALQGISAHRVSTPDELHDQEGKTIVDGVKIDDRGRVLGYYIQEGNTETGYTFRRADEIIHIFEPESPGQYRGLPMLAGVLNDLHDFRDLFDFEKIAAKMQSKDAVFYKNAAGSVPGNTGLAIPPSGIPEATVSDDKSEAKLTALVQKVYGPRALAGKPGDEIQFLGSNRPTVTTQWFFDYLAWRVCCGTGIEKLLVNPQSLQGTVARMALDMATNYFRSRFTVFAGAAHQIYVYAINLARFTDARLGVAPLDWTRAEILPPRAPNVDVGRNSAAMIAELEAGATTFKDIYLPLGRSWRKQLRQRAKEEAYIDQLCAEFKLTPDRIRLSIGESRKADMADETNNRTQEDNTDPGAEDRGQYQVNNSRRPHRLQFA